ncbi:uncharacterized protein [Coffea arabica]|uniref:DUF569 domain-containing protein n=1 Tax=Coffea arabica TaxID=13443 RepID=A0A6P6T9Z4_COFAR|nr:uncharacterized protein LOC113698843 [Coffea arabica]
MELLAGAKIIRLRTHKGKYLIAGDDEESVRQDRDGSMKQARWRVEFVDGNDGVRLKSCYGKYLTATNEPIVPRTKGHKVLQTLPTRLTSAIEWQVERQGSELRFKTHYGQFLRPYGGLPPYRNRVGHDVPCRTHTEDKILWELDILESVDSVKSQENAIH